MRISGYVVILCLLSGQIAAAQESNPPQESVAANPAPTTTANAVSAAIDPFDIDPATIAVPNLTFAMTPEITEDFDKYFYFHRSETDFRTALADILECDGYARGLASGMAGDVNVPYPYTNTMAGVGGAIIAQVLIGAIFGSAALRAKRRINMRTCMGYKGYQRYGLPKPIWQQFNFEEGHGEEEAVSRMTFLRQQARVASAPNPQGGDLGQ